MSPTKRALQESSPHGLHPKRLRGGGNDDDYGGPEPEQLFDEDDFMDDAPPEPDHVDTSADVSLKISEEMKKRWQRPPVPDNAMDQDLNLQWLDIDMLQGNPLAENPNKSKKVLGATTGKVPIIRVYGVNETGNSVVAYIHGFTPYGYFSLPPEYEDSEDAREELRRALNLRLASSARGTHLETYVHGIRYLDNRKSIMGYETPHTRFLQIHVALPTLIPTLRRILEDGIALPGVTGEHSLAPFECNVPFVLRFMIDRDITGAGWLTLPKGTYCRRTHKQTHCQIEVDIMYNEVIPRKSEGEWNKIAPLRILSFDIECQGRKGHFPEAEKDPVIQIANVLTIYGDKDPLAKNIFTLKGCLPIVGAQVITNDREEDLLLQWRTFLEVCDPDILTGYNVQNFDIPYLLDRAHALSKKSARLGGFAQWGRVRNSMAKMKDTMFQSAAYGKRANVETTIEGRVIFDMLPYMQRNHKLSSYSLNSVCAEFLGQQKEDVHHSIISDLQNGTDEDRHRLAIYCLKDAVLPQGLMDKLSVLVNYIEMARVTGVPMSFLISRGQQIKVFSMILRKCRNEKLLVPSLKKSGSPTDDVGYEGATVLDPIKSYYQVPIATLDFASLYPSIMQAWNLCYSTMVNPADVGNLDPKLYKKSENGHVFVHTHVKKGILPTILEELLSARKRAKKDMKNAPTEFERAVQNGRQLALKVSANSVYG